MRGWFALLLVLMIPTSMADVQVDATVEPFSWPAISIDEAQAADEDETESKIICRTERDDQIAPIFPRYNIGHAEIGIFVGLEPSTQEATGLRFEGTTTWIGLNCVLACIDDLGGLCLEQD